LKLKKCSQHVHYNLLLYEYPVGKEYVKKGYDTLMAKADHPDKMKYL